MKNIFSNTSPVTSTSLPTTESLDIDLFISILESLNRMEDDSFNMHKSHLDAVYNYMQEGSVEILQEGFGDFINGCVKFFKSLMARIGKFFDKVMMFIRAYIGDFDKFLTKYKNVILAKKPDFTIEGYTYSFKTDVPNMAIIEHIVSEYNSELANLGTDLNKGHVVDLRNKYASEEFFDGVRGKCLGKSSRIQQGSYVAELRKEFRSDAESARDIHVDNTILRNCIEDYSKLKTSLNDLHKLRSNVTSLLGSLASFFQEGTHVYYKGEKKVIGMDQLSKGDYSINTTDRTVVDFKTEHLAIYDAFYDYKFKQARELSQIAIISITGKIDALKEAMKQYRTIVRKSM